MDAQEQRRLLDLAAKAAGIEIEWNVMINRNSPILAPKTQQERNWLGHEHTTWNPLTDDGDALRLAVKCNLDVCVGYASVSACLQDDGSFHRTVEIKEDPHLATRLAIVRAAAEIGRNRNDHRH